MRVKCGTDIIEIDRIKESIEKLGNPFLERVFTKKEIDYCESKKKQKYQHYAARFAAKEAVFKALSENIQDKFSVSWKDFEVENDKQGKPKINVNAINRYENDFYNHFTLDDQASIIYLKQVPIEDLIKSEFLYAYLSKIIDVEDTKAITYQGILGLNIEKRGTFWNPILVETESRRISKKYSIFYLPKTLGYKEIFMITLSQLNNLETRNLILSNKMDFILSNLSILISRKLLLYEEIRHKN